LLVFTPLAVGLLWMVGVLVLSYERLSLYNMVVISTIVGAGIDASVHLYHSYMERDGGGLRQVVMRTGLAVATASITTGVGFAGMMLSHHQGLASIGKLAVIGLATCLVSALTVLPALLALVSWWQSRKDGRAEPEASQASRHGPPNSAEDDEDVEQDGPDTVEEDDRPDGSALHDEQS
jgi:hypothetical protein